MADISSSCTVKSWSDGNLRKVWVETPNTADTGDTISITLSDHGIKKLKTVTGWAHSTEDSVVVGEAPTTAVSSGVLTITIGGSSASNLKREYIIYGSC